MNSALEIRLTLTLLALGLATGTSFADEIASPQEGECVGPDQRVQVAVSQGSRTVFLNGTDVTASFAETGSSSGPGALSDPESTHSNKPGGYFLRLPGAPGGPRFKITGAAQLTELPGGDLQLQAELTSSSNAQRRFTAYLRLKASSPPRRPIKELQPSNYVPQGTIDPALWDFYRISPWHSYLVGRGQLSGLNYRVWQDWTKPRVQRGSGANGRNLNPGIAGRLWLTRIPFWWRCWWRHRGPRRARFMADEARGSTLEATLSSLPGLVEGTNTLTVQDGSTVTATRTLAYDSTPPSVAATANGALDPAPFVIDFADAGCGVDLASLSVKVNGVDVTPSLTVGASQATGTFSPGADTTELTIEVTLADTVGNVTSTVSLAPILRGVSIRVLDGGVSASSGLSQVEIEVAGISATTNFAGVAELEGVPGGSHVITIDGRPNHVIWQLPVEVTSTSASALTVTLPRLPAGLATALSLTNDNRVQTATRVENPALRSAAIVVPRFTEVSGSPPPAIAIFPVDASLTPAPLPSGFTPSRLYEAYPSGLTFTPGVSLRLPNTAQLPPGTQRDLYGFKADLGGWVVLGKIEVDPTAKFLETTTPYVTSFSLFGYSDSTPITTLARLSLEDWTGALLSGQEVRISGQGSPMADLGNGVYEQSITVARGAPQRAAVTITFPGGLQVAFTTPPTFPDAGTTDLNEGSPLRATLAAKRITLTAGGHTSSALPGDTKSNERVVGAAVGQVAARLAADRNPVSVRFADLGLFTPFVPENKPFGEFTGLPRGTQSAPNFNKALPFRIRVQDNDDDSATTLAYMEFEVLSPNPSAVWASASLAANSGDPTTSLTSSACGREYAYAWDRSSGDHFGVPTEVRLRAIVTDSTGKNHQFFSDSFWVQDSPFTVTRVYPEHNAVGVFTDQSVYVWTSLPIDAATAGAVSLHEGPTSSGPAVPTSVSVEGGLLRLSPRVRLNPLQPYTASVSVGLASNAGDPLPAETTVTFTTAPADGVEDNNQDGLLDCVEVALGLDGVSSFPNSSATDYDGDGKSNYEELFVLGSDPKDPASTSPPPPPAPPGDPVPEGNVESGAIVKLGTQFGPGRTYAPGDDTYKIYVKLSEPTPFSQLDLSLTCGEGLEIWQSSNVSGAARSLVGTQALNAQRLEDARKDMHETSGNAYTASGAYPYEDHYFVLKAGWTAPGLNGRWRPIVTRTTPQTVTLTGPIPRQRLRYLYYVDPDGVQTRYDLGETLVEGVMVEVMTRQVDALLRDGLARTVTVTDNRLGKVLGTVITQVDEPDHQWWQGEFSSIVRGFSDQGVGVNMPTGEAIYGLPLFSASGPGLPVSMGLTYRSYNSAFWKGVARSADVDERVYAPFGHGWSSAYTVRLLMDHWTEPPTAVGQPSTAHVDLVFQDSYGRHHKLTETSAGSKIYRVGGDRILFGTSIGLLLKEQPDGSFRLSAPHTPIRVSFDPRGRLTEIRRKDHGRPLSFDPSQPGKLTITDSQGRKTVWELNDKGRVTKVIAPKDRVWTFEYYPGDHSLKSVSLANGPKETFGYKPSNLHLSHVASSDGRTTQLEYRDPGAHPPGPLAVPSGVPTQVVTRIEAGLSWTNLTYSWSPDFDSTDEWSVAIQRVLNRSETYDFKRSTVTHVNGPYSSVTRYGSAGIASTRIPATNLWTTSYGYNALGQLESIKDYASQLETRWTYTPNNFTVATYSRPQAFWKYTVNTAVSEIYKTESSSTNPEVSGLITEITHPDTGSGAAKTKISYNHHGEVETVTDPIGVVQEFKRSTDLNRAGLPIESIARASATGPPVSTTKATFDEVGNLLTSQSPTGEQVVVSDYNDLDQPRHVQYPGGEERTSRYTPDGELEAVESSWGTTTRIQRDHRRRVQIVTTSGLGSTTYFYNALGELVAVGDERGNKSHYVYDDQGLLKETERLGRKTEVMSRDPRANATEIVDSVVSGAHPPAKTNMEFDEIDRLKKHFAPEITVNGNLRRPRTEHSYLDTNLAGSFTYLEDNKFLGASYGYDARNRPTTMTHGGAWAVSSTQEQVLDDAGNVRKVLGHDFRPPGNSTVRARPEASVELDGIGRPTVSSVEGKETGRVRRDPASRVLEVFARDSNEQEKLVVRRTFDTKGRLETVTNAYGNTVTISYDGKGRLQKMVDPEGRTTEIVYDDLSRRKAVKNSGPDQARTEERFTYTDYSEVKTRTQVVQPRSPVGAPEQTWTTTYTYDGEGRTKTITDPLGHESEFRYDDWGRVKTVHTPKFPFPAYAREFEYDTHHRVTRMLAPSSIAGVGSEASENTISYNYDGAGKVLSEENPGYRREYAYDEKERLVTVKLINKTNSTAHPPRTFTLAYEDDKFGSLKTMTDPEGLVTHYTYVRGERLETISHSGLGAPAGAAAQFAYDHTGRIKSWKAGPATLAQVRDATGRLETQVGSGLVGASASQNQDVVVTRDNLGRRVKTEYRHLRTLSPTSTGVSREARYDSVGRLSQEIVREDGAPTHVEISKFDDAGNRVEHRVNGVVNTYRVNEFNQIVSHKKTTAVKVNGLTAPRADSVFLGSPMDYGPALAADGTVDPGSTAPGRSFVSGSGTGEHWIEFDVGSEIPIVQVDVNLPVDHGLPSDLRLEYLEDDGFFGVWKEAELCAALGADIRGGNDANGTTPAIPWSFKPVSTKVTLYTAEFRAKVFRIRQPAGGAPVPALPQHGGALAVSEVEAYTVGAATFKQMAYDDNGNLIRVGPDMGPSRRYRYDSQDRLVGVTDDTDSANPVSMVMSYGPRGQLLKTVDLAAPGMPERHRLLWGGQIYAEYSTSGVLLQKYILGPSIDAKIGQIPGGNFSDVQFTLPDAHGSVHQSVDSLGAVEETKFYSAWGVSLNVVGTALATNAVASRFGYNGRPDLGNSGLLDFRARFYDPDLGRFLNADPSGTSDGMNRYAFVHGDPMNRVDRNGLNDEIANSGKAKPGPQPRAAGPQPAQPRPAPPPRLGLGPGGLTEGGPTVRPNTAAREDHLRLLGRRDYQARLRQYATVGHPDHEALPKHIRGWFRRELANVNSGRRRWLRLPYSGRNGLSGFQLQHPRGLEARKGHSYLHAVLNNIADHRTQHRHDDWGRANAERLLPGARPNTFQGRLTALGRISSHIRATLSSTQGRVGIGVTIFLSSTQLANASSEVNLKTTEALHTGNSVEDTVDNWMRGHVRKHALEMVLEVEAAGSPINKFNRFIIDLPREIRPDLFGPPRRVILDQMANEALPDVKVRRIFTPKDMTPRPEDD